MSRHPSKLPDQEDHVRKRAHAMWEKEGRPHGKEKEHWERALQELRSEEERASSIVATKKKKKPPAGTGSSNEKRKRPSPR
jgi:hypothetical protein